jgi:hypothetical protein
MPGKVTLEVTAGPMQGRRFEFTSHDTFIFGRAADCHAGLPQGDTSASRHHFLLEVNPPLARLRDLGSLNGTRVNGVRHGGRAADETPEEAARRGVPEVDLRDGDELQVGATKFRISLPGAPTSLTPPRIEELQELDEPASRPTGHSVPGYDLGDVLGRGGMGAVYRARRRSDGREVALKIMLPHVTVDDAARESFLREIEVTRSLRHPRIVELLDFGYAGDGFFFAMELCPGGSAAALAKAAGGRLPLPRAVALARESLEGLAFAHERGFVHRDIKPDNVLVAADGSARVTDFGLAKSFQQAGLSGMTATGTVAGTPFFMPREQLTSYRQLKPASDVFSMGATLYNWLTGSWVREFARGKDPLAVILKGGVVPIRTRAPQLALALATVIDRAVTDNPAERYPDAGAFLKALVEAT